MVPQIWHSYKAYGSAEIAEEVDDDFGDFSKDAEEVLTEVYEVFGQFSAWKLRNMTHNEPPWQEAWARGSGGEIAQESLREYFKNYVTS